MTAVACRFGTWRRLGAAAVLAVVAGCSSTPGDRVILLPQPDGSPSAVEVTAGSQRLQLETPYATADLRDGRLAPGTTTAQAVQQAYGALLSQLPARPRLFTVQFEPNGNRLAAGADAVLADMRAALAQLPAPEVVVTGHTDRVGTVEANDRLSLVRAEAVREILVRGGVPAAAITVAGRGEREPAVPTADEVAEARNRRVEIKIR
ncbi:OmpA family protein [Pseudaquabacterium pictum]|uniref:OmpA family protein n=1 Tax=Pseudaquabacterium pictum TaxID=2315236 RepID=UPI0010F82DAE|nr:OmpA family protein [Rubrivivax pictus]